MRHISCASASLSLLPQAGHRLLSPRPLLQRSPGRHDLCGAVGAEQNSLSSGPCQRGPVCWEVVASMVRHLHFFPAFHASFPFSLSFIGLGVYL